MKVQQLTKVWFVVTEICFSVELWVNYYIHCTTELWTRQTAVWTRHCIATTVLTLSVSN